MTAMYGEGDEHRRSGGAEDWTWERRRMSLYADEILNALELDFLAVLADHAASEQTEAEASPKKAKTAARITVPVSTTRDHLEGATRAWMRLSYAPNDPVALKILMLDVVNPVMKALYTKAVEEGWF